MKPRALAPSASPAPTAGRIDDRIAPRQAMVSLVWFHSVVDPEGEDQVVEGIARSVDVSRRGLGLITTQPVPVGTLLFMEITLRRTSATGPGTHFAQVHCVGRAMHCSETEDGSHRVGIRVELVPPSERALLERILAP